MSKPIIPYKEAVSFLTAQSKTNYSNIYLLEVHRGLQKISKIFIKLCFTSGFSGTLMALEKTIRFVENIESDCPTNFELVPLTPTQLNELDSINVTLPVSSNAEIDTCIQEHSKNYFSDPYEF